MEGWKVSDFGEIGRLYGAEGPRQVLGQAHGELAFDLGAAHLVGRKAGRTVEVAVGEHAAGQRAVVALEDLHGAHGGANLPAGHLAADQLGLRSCTA
jgi:hypothetical protein